MGRSFARLVTDVVVRFPALWPLFRGALRKQFDELSPRWDTILGEDHLAPYEAALEAIENPDRALDLGTGTGAGAFALARRFPQAEVVGADLAEGMLAEARRKTPPELTARVRFERADAAHLPYADDSFDLVGLVNMIPFFDELARVVAPSGTVVIAFSSGADTPIWVPLDRLRRELAQRGFSEFAKFSAGRGVALVARKAERA
jgi:demethylmenaquinone methyltransferase/2-methoxy-6-polyprenyl-1,4-benzoquinol methylase